MGDPLTRFWFPVAGHLGIGVTAEDLPEATRLATGVALARGLSFDAPEVEQNVDPAHLVPHVRRESAAIAARGVWFPRTGP